MKAAIFVCAIFLFLHEGFSQTQTQAVRPTKEQIIEKVCKAPEIRSGTEFDQMRRVELKLDTIINQDRQHRVYIAARQQRRD